MGVKLVLDFEVINKLFPLSEVYFFSISILGLFENFDRVKKNK